MRGVLLAALVASGCSTQTNVVVQELPPQDLPAPQATASAPVAQPVTPLRAGETWVGHYTCAQGETSLQLQITNVGGGGAGSTSVEAVFRFSHAASGSAGSYRMRGSMSEDGGVRLRPGAWIDRPAGYMSVGMTGRVQGDGFTGRMEHASCGSFELQR